MTVTKTVATNAAFATFCRKLAARVALLTKKTERLERGFVDLAKKSTTVKPKDGAQGPKGDQGPQGPQGKRGIRGLPGRNGEDGNIPAHRWIGTALQFQLPNGRWGHAMELKGDRGIPGAGSSAVSSSDGRQEIFILATPSSPTPVTGYPAVVFRPTGTPGQYTMEVVQ